MKMDMIIDFNGFLIDDWFQLREYALYTFDSKTGLKSGNQHHEVTKLSLEYEKVNNNVRENYQDYFELYGIEWRTGNKDDRSITQQLTKLASKAKHVFVNDKRQEKLLKKYLNLNEDIDQYHFICLDNLGFLVEPRRSTACSHHNFGYKNNCAKDNLDVMFEWLIESRFYDDHYRSKLHMVVDFTVYHMPYRAFTIKEFSCCFMDENGQKNNSDIQLVKSPLEDYNSLPEPYKTSYNSFYEHYSIPWGLGTCEFNDSRKMIKNYFKNAAYVYVKNYNKKKLLMSYIKDLFASNCNLKIICLDEFGYNLPPILLTECKYHDKKESYCALENSYAMTKWLQEKKMYIEINRIKYSSDIYYYVQTKKIREYGYYD
ncbi:putative Bracovirus protein MdBV-1-17 [Microplitis demolitor]